MKSPTLHWNWVNVPMSLLLLSWLAMCCRLSSMRLNWEILVLTSLLRRCSSESLDTSSPRHFVISDVRWLQKAQREKHILFFIYLWGTKCAAIKGKTSYRKSILSRKALSSNHTALLLQLGTCNMPISSPQCEQGSHRRLREKEIPPELLE